MKKLFTRSIALVMCAAICISLAACGKKAASVEEYISNNQTMVNAFVESQSNELITVTVTGDGNTMVFTYQLASGIISKDDENYDEMVSGFEAGLDLMESDFSDMLSELKKEVPSAEAIRVEFLNDDGSVMLSKDFT